MKPIGTLLKTAHGQFWSVSPEDTVFNALQLLAQYEVGALMVMEAGRLVGVFSERDYTRKIALAGRHVDGHLQGVVASGAHIGAPRTSAMPATLAGSGAASNMFCCRKPSMAGCRRMASSNPGSEPLMYAPTCTRSRLFW